MTYTNMDIRVWNSSVRFRDQVSGNGHLDRHDLGRVAPVLCLDVAFVPVSFRSPIQSRSDQLAPEHGHRLHSGHPESRNPRSGKPRDGQEQNDGEKTASIRPATPKSKCLQESSQGQRCNRTCGRPNCRRSRHEVSWKGFHPSSLLVRSAGSYIWRNASMGSSLVIL